LPVTLGRAGILCERFLQKSLQTLSTRLTGGPTDGNNHDSNVQKFEFACHVIGQKNQYLNLKALWAWSKR